MGYYSTTTTQTPRTHGSKLLGPPASADLSASTWDSGIAKVLLQLKAQGSGPGLRPCDQTRVLLGSGFFVFRANPAKR